MYAICSVQGCRDSWASKLKWIWTYNYLMKKWVQQSKETQCSLWQEFLAAPLIFPRKYISFKRKIRKKKNISNFHYEYPFCLFYFQSYKFRLLAFPICPTIPRTPNLLLPTCHFFPNIPTHFVMATSHPPRPISWNAQPSSSRGHGAPPKQLCTNLEPRSSVCFRPWTTMVGCDLKNVIKKLQAMAGGMDVHGLDMRKSIKKVINLLY